MGFGGWQAAGERTGMQAGRKTFLSVGRTATPTAATCNPIFSSSLPSQMSPGVRQCTFTQRVSLGTLQGTGPWVRPPPPLYRALQVGGGSPAVREGLLATNPFGLWGLIAVSFPAPGLSGPQPPPQGYGYEKPLRPFPDDVCVVPEKFEGQRRDYSSEDRGHSHALCVVTSLHLPPALGSRYPWGEKGLLRGPEGTKLTRPVFCIPRRYQAGRGWGVQRGTALPAPGGFAAVAVPGGPAG